MFSCWLSPVAMLRDNHFGFFSRFIVLALMFVSSPASFKRITKMRAKEKNGNYHFRSHQEKCLIIFQTLFRFVSFILFVAELVCLIHLQRLTGVKLDMVAASVVQMQKRAPKKPILPFSHEWNNIKIIFFGHGHCTAGPIYLVAILFHILCFHSAFMRHFNEKTNIPDHRRMAYLPFILYFHCLLNDYYYCEFICFSSQFLRIVFFPLLVSVPAHTYTTSIKIVLAPRRAFILVCPKCGAFVLYGI